MLLLISLTAVEMIELLLSLISSIRGALGWAATDTGYKFVMQLTSCDSNATGWC